MDKMKNRIEVKPDIEDGDVGLDESYADPKNHKLRITTWIDGDVYAELQRRADGGEGKGRYQTLMNDLLRQTLFGKKLEKTEEISETTKALLKSYARAEVEKVTTEKMMESAKKAVREEIRKAPVLFQSNKKSARSTKKTISR